MVQGSRRLTNSFMNIAIFIIWPNIKKMVLNIKKKISLKKVQIKFEGTRATK